MVDASSASPCGSAGLSKLSKEQRDSAPSEPSQALPAPILQQEIPNPQTAPPMEPEAARILPPITVPVGGEHQAHPPTTLRNHHQYPMPPPFFPQNGPSYSGTAAPMEPSAIYPMPFMPTMGYYPPAMPMPYYGYHPHHPSYPTFANGLSTPQHLTRNNGHQSQFNSAYQPPAEIVSLPGDSAMNRLAPPQSFPISANPLYKEADNRVPLPSFRSLENATRRSVSGEPSQAPKRCGSPLSNPPAAKKRRANISEPGLSEIQANGMHGDGPASDEKGILSTGANKKQQCTANASIRSPSNPDKSEVANTGSTHKSTAESSKKSGGNMRIRDIVHPSEMQSPPPNPIQTDQSHEPIAPRDVPQVVSQNPPPAPYSATPVADVPPPVMGMPNLGSNYFGTPYHDQFRQYPSTSKLLYNPVHPQGHAQGYGSTLPGQAGYMMGMHPHQAIGHQSYPVQRFHPIPAGPYRSTNFDPLVNKMPNAYGSRLSTTPHPIRQHAVQIAPAPSGSSHGNLASNSLEFPPHGTDLPDRLYDLSAIEKLGCKVRKWRVYNEQNHPVCAAPRENGVPCRRNVSRSPCKWHGLVVPLRPNNTINGRLDADGNLIQSFIPQAEAAEADAAEAGAAEAGVAEAGPSEAGPSENLVARDRSLRVRATRAVDTSDSQSRIHRWNDKEHFLFLLGYREYGKSWAKISKVVQSRTTLQTQSHAQKFFERRRKQEKKKSTIHDLVFESPEMQAIYNSTPKEVIEGYLARAFARVTDHNAEEQPREREQRNAPSSDE